MRLHKNFLNLIPDKDKFGFIANTTGAHIAINVTDFKSHGRFEVSFVMSYENFGALL